MGERGRSCEGDLGDIPCEVVVMEQAMILTRFLSGPDYKPLLCQWARVRNKSKTRKVKVPKKGKTPNRLG